MNAWNCWATVSLTWSSLTIFSRNILSRQRVFLTEMRSKVVSRDQLNQVALKLGLEELIRVRKGVGDLMNSSVLGNALEALTGALYLDQGYHPSPFLPPPHPGPAL